MHAGTLQIFNGTLTEITCSATVPLFRLVKEESVYDSYDELPVLFDIEARLSRSGEVVALHINGTNRSNNLTVICRSVDFNSGQIEILFTLTLEFSRFHKLTRFDIFITRSFTMIDILPAPNNVHSIEDPAGYLQIFWDPPTL